ncbi:MAG: AraC family transcriptional regulator [Polyangiaceae bacterium]
MIGGEQQALFQRFLPDRQQRAFVWKYAQSTGGRRPRHFHDEPEFNLVVRGSALFGVGDRQIAVSQGDLLAFPPGQDHVLLAGSSDLFLYAIGVAAECSAEVIGESRGPMMPLHVRVGASELAATVARAAAIVDCAGAGPLGAELWARMHWLGERGASSTRSHVLTRRALQFIRTAPDFGLGALARDVRAHPSEISRYFHRDMGTTLVSYRRRLRLLEVIRLVDAGELDLMAAASVAGFGSYSQCHRAFRAEFRCAPSHFFREDLRQQMQVVYEAETGADADL